MDGILPHDIWDNIIPWCEQISYADPFLCHMKIWPMNLEIPDCHSFFRIEWTSEILLHGASTRLGPVSQKCKSVGLRVFPGRHVYGAACICLCEPIKSVSLIATNCLTQLACVLIQKAQNFALAVQHWAVQCAGQSRTERWFTFFPTPCFHPESNKSWIHTSYSTCSFSLKSSWKMCLKRP